MMLEKKLNSYMPIILALLLVVPIVAYASGEADGLSSDAIHLIGGAMGIILGWLFKLTRDNATQINKMKEKCSGIHREK